MPPIVLNRTTEEVCPAPEAYGTAAAHRLTGATRKFVKFTIVLALAGGRYEFGLLAHCIGPQTE